MGGTHGRPGLFRQVVFQKCVHRQAWSQGAGARARGAWRTWGGGGGIRSRCTSHTKQTRDLASVTTPFKYWESWPQVRPWQVFMSSDLTLDTALRIRYNAPAGGFGASETDRYRQSTCVTLMSRSCQWCHSEPEQMRDTNVVSVSRRAI